LIFVKKCDKLILVYFCEKIINYFIFVAQKNKTTKLL